ncbi:MAG: hypothetical protein IT444_08365 [Phycisphaeraceae bacterium]|nr:hypothetical protein [Phycisphaeraceae bacterium]
MNHCPSRAAGLFTLITAIFLTTATALAADAQPTPTLKLNEVKIGMKGYGLTVFHGDKIEPFEVEVVSVVPESGVSYPGPARHGMIWIRCPDPRMQKTGPVQGMSGSPIYLWDEGEPHELGKGGKLIGAFAFGFQATKDCLVGVQPIQYMRGVGDRALEDAKHPDQVTATDFSLPEASLQTLLKTVSQDNLSPSVTWRAQLLGKMQRHLLKDNPATFDTSPRVTAPVNESAHGELKPLMLTMGVHTPKFASLIAPMLAPMGIAPFETPIGVVVGSGPPDVDVKAIPLKPGGVLAIPLAYGDLDLSGVGTVTDVLPDGRVLAFGHAMFGQGSSAVPMASGYIHLIVPSLGSSFKIGGSGVIRGTITRDEASAVAGIPEAKFDTSPVRVRVQMPRQKPAEYNYRVVHHKGLIATITSMLAVESMTALQNPPIESTAYVTTNMTFAGNRKLTFHSIIPDPRPESLMMEFLPPISTMVDNEHESVMLESADINIEIKPNFNIGSIANVRLDRTILKPGQKLGMTVRIDPYGKKSFEKRAEITIPENLSDGDYQLYVCDASSYSSLWSSNRPHLNETTNVDEIYTNLQRVMAVPSNALFLVLQIQQQGLAVGRQEMPHLPLSRKAMISTPTSSQATAYGESTDRIIPMNLVTVGSMEFTISVRRNPLQD